MLQKLRWKGKRRGVRKLCNWQKKGGKVGLDLPFFADIFCKQPLSKGSHQMCLLTRQIKGLLYSLTPSSMT